jgi:hypothetical protein
MSQFYKIYHFEKYITIKLKLSFFKKSVKIYNISLYSNALVWSSTLSYFSCFFFFLKFFLSLLSHIKIKTIFIFILHQLIFITIKKRKEKKDLSNTTAVIAY